MTYKGPGEAELTSEESLNAFYRFFLNAAISTEPADVPLAESAMRRLYTLLGEKQPKEFMWVQSPDQARNIIQRLDRNAPTAPSLWGQLDMIWLSYQVVGNLILLSRGEPETDESRITEAWYDLAMSSGPVYAFENVCIMCDRFERFEVTMSGEGQMHCLDDYAVKWRDGTGICFVRDVEIPEEYVFHREKLTTGVIWGTTNAAMRRALVELYGEGKFVQDVGAKEVDRVGEIDGEPYFVRGATLYRVDLQGDEPIVMVKMEDCTPDPDGSRAIYYRRVPPAIATAKEAMAWTKAIPAIIKPEFQT